MDTRAAMGESIGGKKNILIQHIESTFPPKVYVFSSNRGARTVFLKHFGRARLEGFLTIDNAAFVCFCSRPDQCPCNLIFGPNSLSFDLRPRCIPREGTGESEYSIFVSRYCSQKDPQNKRTGPGLACRIWLYHFIHIMGKILVFIQIWLIKCTSYI